MLSGTRWDFNTIFISVYAPMALPVAAPQELVERIRFEGLRLDHLDDRPTKDFT
jgi:hypothetical protein